MCVVFSLDGIKDRKEKLTCKVNRGFFKMPAMANAVGSGNAYMGVEAGSCDVPHQRNQFVFIRIFRDYVRFPVDVVKTQAGGTQRSDAGDGAPWIFSLSKNASRVCLIFSPRFREMT